MNLYDAMKQQNIVNFLFYQVLHSVKCIYYELFKNLEVVQLIIIRYHVFSLFCSTRYL